MALSPLVPAALSVFVSSLIPCRLIFLPRRDFCCFSRREWTKHAVSCRFSAGKWASLGLSVVTREDLRRCALSASNTTYSDTSASPLRLAVITIDLECMLIFGFARTGLAAMLWRVSLCCLYCLHTKILHSYFVFVDYGLGTLWIREIKLGHGLLRCSFCHN